MIAYTLAFILVFSLISDIWHSLVLFFASMVFAPADQRAKVLLSTFLALFIFLIIFPHKDIEREEYPTVLEGFAYSLDDSKVELYTSSAMVKPILLYVWNTDARFVGERVRVVKPRLIENKTHNLREFDFPEYINSRGYSSGYFCEKLVVSEESGKDLPSRRIVGFLRSYMWVKAKYLNDSAYKMYSALIMGSMDFKSDLGELVKSHGIVHIFVVSGFHFSIIFMGIRTLFIYLTGNRYKISIILACVLAGIYHSVLVGSFGSTRAFVSIIIGVISFFIGRSHDSENTLFLLTMFWLVSYPSALGQTGFILSFVSTYIVILVGGLEIVKNTENKISKLLLVSLISSFILSFFLGSLGISPPVFSFISIVLSSILFLPFLPFMFLFSLIPEGFSPFIKMSAYLINLVSDIYINFLSALRGMSVLRIEFPIFFSLIFSSLIVLFFISRKLKSSGWKTKQIISIGLVLVILLGSNFYNFSDMEVISYDLRDGEAYLIKAGDNCIVYDVGNDKNLIKLLRAEGVKSIDLLIISHADQDHYGIVDLVYKEFDVKKMVVDDSEKTIKLGNMKLDFYRSDDVSASRNDISLICKVSLKSTQVLLTGDIQAIGIRDLLKEDIEDVDILKAPHHGSYTENLPDLIEATSPEMVLISGGRGKRIDKVPLYDELNNIKMKFYDTMKHGELRLNYINGRWNVELGGN